MLIYGEELTNQSCLQRLGVSYCTQSGLALPFGIEEKGMESTQNASTTVVQLAERRSLQLFTTPLKVSWEQVELV